MGLCVSLIIALSIAWVGMNYRRPSSEGFSPREASGQSPSFRDVTVNLTSAKLDVKKKSLIGKAQINVRPGNFPEADASDEKLKEFKKDLNDLSSLTPLMLRLSHFMTGEEKEGSAGYLYQGGTSKALEMSVDPRTRIEINGAGDFEWQVQSRRSSFWYPFDSYFAYVNPSVSWYKFKTETVNKGADKKAAEKTSSTEVIDTLIFNVDQMTFETSDTNLNVQLALKFKEHENSSSPDKMRFDPYELHLTRPISLQITTIVAIALMFCWLGYLYFYEDVEKSASNLLSFFVGALATRSTLLSGIDFSPVFLDYFILAFSLTAIGIVITRWLDKKWASSDKINCPYCDSKISNKADYCPNCTRKIVKSENDLPDKN